MSAAAVVAATAATAVTHCTFTDTGYTGPRSFPFFCNIQGIPADVTELEISPGGTVSETCIATPGA